MLLYGSGIITAEDREFLLHHWDKTVSSTRDSVTKILVEKKLARIESYQKYSSTQSTPLFSTSPGPSDDVSPSSHSATSTEEYTPKRPCTQSVGTTVEIPKDYKEFLELAKLILGETVERKKGYVFQIQRPGADHHARWMAKSIYIMKMALLLHQIPLHWTKKRNVQKMAHFVVFVYLRAWFSAPVLEAAATNDIRLFQSLQKYKSVDKKVSTITTTVLKKVSTITTTVLNRHTWYLTEEVIPLSLFDEDLTLCYQFIIQTSNR